jgi:hypothetical protein
LGKAFHILLSSAISFILPGPLLSTASPSCSGLSPLNFTTLFKKGHITAVGIIHKVLENFIDFQSPVSNWFIVVHDTIQFLETHTILHVFLPSLLKNPFGLSRFSCGKKSMQLLKRGEIGLWNAQEAWDSKFHKLCQ